MQINKGLAVWLTGLSGAGKTTIALAVSSMLCSRGVPVQILDGDDVRRQLSPDLGYSLIDRLENVRRVTYLAGILARNRVVVLVAMISPLGEMRESARIAIPSFLEVFVDASLATCERRDPKGLYKKARSGLLSGFTGVDSPYEFPNMPDVTCFTDRESIQESAEKVIAAILKNVCAPVSLPAITKAPSEENT